MTTRIVLILKLYLQSESCIKKTTNNHSSNNIYNNTSYSRYLTTKSIYSYERNYDVQLY
jgi:hypothetical protein